MASIPRVSRFVGTLIALVGVASASAPERASAMSEISSQCNFLNPIQICEVVEFDICIPGLFPGEVECTHHRNEIPGEIRDS